MNSGERGQVDEQAGPGRDGGHIQSHKKLVTDINW